MKLPLKVTLLGNTLSVQSRTTTYQLLLWARPAWWFPRAWPESPDGTPVPVLLYSVRAGWVEARVIPNLGAHDG